MPTEDYESPQYVAVKQSIVDALKGTKKALSCREIKTRIGTDEFVGDALEYLCFIGLIEDVGSLLIAKYKYRGTPKVTSATKQCPTCKEVKELIDFYLEWSGATSKNCKACKSAAARRRKPPKKQKKIKAVGM